MTLEKGMIVNGIVTELYNYGIFLELENGAKAFLPKEAMFITRKKKISDIFSVGYNLSARVFSKKKDYFVLTQKELVENNTTNKEDEKKQISKDRKKEVKKEKNSPNPSKIKPKNEQKVANKQLAKKEKPKEEKLEKKQSPSLNNLKNLSVIGNIKISHQKKNSITKLADEKKKQVRKEKIFLPLPENFIENIIESYEENSKQLAALQDRVKERGWLNED